MLKDKEISLAMIFNREGEILWHRGRCIRGKTLNEGEGFSRSLLKQSILKGKPLETEEVVVSAAFDGLPDSASYLNIKSIMILPLSHGIFLYLDSGIKDSFSQSDRQFFKVSGELLGELIDDIRRRQEQTGGITGSSSQVKTLRELVLKYSLEDDPILLTGETGSGKNHIAELIHHYSGRPGKFVTINTPGIPAELFESELFGHVRGAYTGAVEDKKGWVEEAGGGTILFDEITELPPAFQAKLLRFIETKKYFVLGTTTEKTADVRILAATNRNPAQAIQNKQFREDLYFRLQVLEIKIPPLRERKEDIPALVNDLHPVLKGKTIGSGFWQAFKTHDWPGNIRELKSVLKRIAIFSGETILGSDVAHSIQQSSLPHSVSGIGADNSITANIRRQLHQGADFWEAVKKPFLNRDFNRSQVKKCIDQALEESGGRYVDVLSFFNLPRKDYHRFMSFLSDYKLK